MEKKKKEKGIVITIPFDFNLKLKRRLLELEEEGIVKTKADLVIELAQIGFNKETNGNHEKL